MLNPVFPDDEHYSTVAVMINIHVCIIKQLRTDWDLKAISRIKINYKTEKKAKRSYLYTQKELIVDTYKVEHIFQLINQNPRKTNT